MTFSFILLGAPGSGKGTQASRLEQKFNLYNFSLGNIIRQEISSKSALGLEMKQFAESGLLIPDSVIIKVVEDFFVNFTGTGFISDGFPRNLFQAKVLDTLFLSKNLPLPKLIYLKLNLDLLLQRLLGRRICSGCGTVFHVEFSPPKQTGICDHCQSTLTVRADDTESVIIQRFNVFQNEIDPVLAFYGPRVLEVDALNSPSDVFDFIVASLSTSQI